MTTIRTTVMTNHPIIIRFSAPNHPIGLGKRFRARSESTDNRPIFRRESPDATAKIVRNRQAMATESSDRLLGFSRHSSRQNGERDEPKSRIPGDPAVFPAILRDSPSSRAGNGQSCHFSCQNARRCTESGHRFRVLQPPPQPADLSAVALTLPNGAKAETYRPIAEIVEELAVIENEARKTDAALRKILKQLGIGA